MAHSYICDECSTVIELGFSIEIDVVIRESNEDETTLDYAITNGDLKTHAALHACSAQCLAKLILEQAEQTEGG